MAITRTDETELLPALHDGMHETPLWATFLDRLRRRTRSTYVSLIFRQRDAPMADATEFFSGRDLRTAARPLIQHTALDPIRYDHLRPGRVYSTDELIDPLDASHARYRRNYLDPLGIRYGRFMRVGEAGGTSLWTILTHDNRDFGAADSALLAALAPHLAIALRSFAVLERARFEALVSADVLKRAGLSWTALAETRVPGADAIDLPAPRLPLAAIAMPATIAVTRTAPAFGARDAAALSRRWDLTPSEARLALSLADGTPLVDAAGRLGLTLETARNYTKRIFSKTGTSGQVQLVRLVLTSAAILA